MTTPVTTTEFFTLTGVLSCANALFGSQDDECRGYYDKRYYDKQRNGHFHKRFPRAEAFPALLYFPAWAVFCLRSAITRVYDL